MFSVTAVQTFVDAPLYLVSGIGDMLLHEQGGNLMLYAATRAGGGVLALDVDAGMVLADSQAFNVTSQLPVAPTLDVVAINGQPHLVVSGSNQTTLLTIRIESLGTIGSYVKPAGGPAGVIASQAVLTLEGQTYLYVNMANDSSVRVFSMAPNGTLTQVQDLAVGADAQGVVLSEMTTLEVAGSRYLAAVSTTEDRLVLMRIGADGRLTESASVGAGNGLGIDAPTGLEVLVAHGRSYLVVTAPGTSTLSLVEVTAQGTLRVAETLADTLDTRFQSVTASASVMVGGRAFVLAGGNDGGLNLFEVLPDGRMVLQGEILQEPGMALGSISSITVRVTASGLDVFVAGEGTGITRLSVAMADLPLALRGSGADDALTGGGGADLIVGEAGADVLTGNGGDDVLVDGAGVDTLWGGTGADLFVLTRDDETDVIRDYQPGIDRIDLSRWGRVYDLSALTITAVAGGAVITFGDERLEVFSSNGLPLQASAFQNAGFFDLWHADASLVLGPRIFGGSAASEKITGTSADDRFLASEGLDTIVGMQGIDHIDMSAAEATVYVNLQAGRSTGFWAAGQQFASIEWVTGGDHFDYLAGSAANNRLWGNAGQDTLLGRDGNDTLYGDDGDDLLIGGRGGDMIYGGDGIDEVSYQAADRGVRVELGENIGLLGEAVGDQIYQVENLHGSAHDDRLTGSSLKNTLLGGAGNDQLLGLDGNDVLVGGAGDDILLGGGGADVIKGGSGVDEASYLTAATAVLADLMVRLAGQGDAAGDSFSGIENLTGSRFNDSIYGNNGGNVILGLQAGTGSMDEAAMTRSTADWAMIPCSAAAAGITSSSAVAKTGS